MGKDWFGVWQKVYPPGNKKASQDNKEMTKNNKGSATSVPAYIKKCSTDKEGD